MKKTIQDLRLNDIVYLTNGTSEIKEMAVTSISINELVIDKSYKFKMSREDYTRFNFEATYYSTHFFYLSKLDALKVRQKALDDEIEKVYNSQIDFLLKIQGLNSKIRENDKLISLELIK